MSMHLGLRRRVIFVLDAGVGDMRIEVRSSGRAFCFAVFFVVTIVTIVCRQGAQGGVDLSLQWLLLVQLSLTALIGKMLLYLLWCCWRWTNGLGRMSEERSLALSLHRVAV